MLQSSAACRSTLAAAIGRTRSAAMTAIAACMGLAPRVTAAAAAAPAAVSIEARGTKAGLIVITAPWWPGLGRGKRGKQQCHAWALYVLYNSSQRQRNNIMLTSALYGWLPLSEQPSVSAKLICPHYLFEIGAFCKLLRTPAKAPETDLH